MDQNITMSRKEIRYAEVLQQVKEKSLNQKEGATILGITPRHFRRIQKKFEKGLPGLVHQGRGRVSNRKIPETEERNILGLLREKYPDFGPTFASEKLSEDHGITHDPKTIRSLMIKDGLWKSKKRKREMYRAWRERRASFGEMQQYDGSYEHWFEDRGEKCCLLVSIDDATSQVTQAIFEEHEGVLPTFLFWETYFRSHGKPQSIYVDKFSTYSMNHKLAKENTDTLTQFGRAMQECGVEVITAHSSQAKGRVERLFRTFQDRLIKELRLRNISTQREANVFLKEIFLASYNAKFAVVARTENNQHTILSGKERESLSAIFSRQYERVVRNDFTLSYKNIWYQLSEEQPVTVFKGDAITIEERLDGSIHMRLRGKYLSSSQLPARPIKVKTLPIVLRHRVPCKPTVNHPWRKFHLVH